MDRVGFFHPYAEMLPPIDPADIRRGALQLKGVPNPATRVAQLDGKVLDRVAFEIIIKAGLTPNMVAFTGDDPALLVISKWLTLKPVASKSQVGLYAHRVVEWEDQQGVAEKYLSRYPIKAGRASQIGARFNLGHTVIHQLARVLNRGTQALIQAVNNGTVSGEQAYRICQLDMDGQAAVLAIPGTLARNEEIDRRIAAKSTPVTVRRSTQLIKGKNRPIEIAPIAQPGTPYVRRVLGRMEGMVMDLSGEFGADTPEKIAERFIQEYDASNPILQAQLNHALIVMKAAAQIVNWVEPLPVPPWQGYRKVLGKG